MYENLLSGVIFMLLINLLKSLFVLLFDCFGKNYINKSFRLAEIYVKNSTDL